MTHDSYHNLRQPLLTAPNAAPVFSVITPVYNGEAFVDRCYRCLALQTFTDWEWVVVDDGSTDHTAELVRRIADPRVRLTSYQPNRGRGHARLQALEASRGDWMVVWDVDDLHYPDRLARIHKPAGKATSLLSYASGRQRICAQGRTRVLSSSGCLPALRSSHVGLPMRLAASRYTTSPTGDGPCSFSR